MNLAAGWTQSGFVRALGWALWHFLWQGGLAAVALAVVLRFCRRAATRYRAACIAAAAMLAAFAITFVVSLPQRPFAVPPESLHTIATGADTAGALLRRAPGVLARIRQFLPLAVPFWMAGALLMAIYRMGGWASAQRLRRTGVCAAPPVWQARLTQLARRIGASKPLLLLESAFTDAPVVIGYLRPAILLPAGLLTGMPPAHVEAILLHELAHIRRSDYLVNLLQTVLESLLFYHPAVWWISGLLRAEREKCCDDLVVATQGDAAGYAAALVTLEERRWSAREPALAATGGNLMNRIRRLLNQPEKTRPAAALVLSIGLLLGMCCLLAVAQQNPARPGDQTAKQSAYTRWVGEDVLYIIKPEERAAFLRLRTDEERDHFIAQFWLRRDPTPGTPENEFKEEHYRRIAFANQHWSTKVPGWRTDRGRLYIVYGPPDEIESHPDRWLEQWMYYHLNGIGHRVIVDFEDTSHTGDYRMTKDPSPKSGRSVPHTP